VVIVDVYAFVVACLLAAAAAMDNSVDEDIDYVCSYFIYIRYKYCNSDNAIMVSNLAKR